MNIFEFTGEDLTLNKRGLLSARQKEWLGMTARGIRSCSSTSALVAVFFLVPGLGMTLVLYLQNERSRAALFSNPLNVIVFPATALIVLIILPLRRALSAWIMIRQETVASLVIMSLWERRDLHLATIRAQCSKTARTIKFITANLGHMRWCCRMSSWLSDCDL